jgi:hypothetical protein
MPRLARRLLGLFAVLALVAPAQAQPEEREEEVPPEAEGEPSDDNEGEASEAEAEAEPPPEPQPTAAPGPRKPSSQSRDREPEDPEAGRRRPDAPDLLAGHFLMALDGGVWVPSSGLLPEFPELGDVEVGGTAHLRLGMGLNRYLVLGLDGGFANVPRHSDTCDGCGVWSIEAGAHLAFRLTQGFALEPWASYGAGYRHNLVMLAASEETVSSVDVAKLALGADWYPSSFFGFGPYIETDIGVRVSGDVAGYAVFHTGLRIAFDPVRAGTQVSPVTDEKVQKSARRP